MRVKPAVLIALLAGVTLLAYARVWSFGMVYDDLNWVGKPIAVESWPYWARAPWVVAQWIGHGQLWAYHGLVVCIHLVNGLLVYRLARYLLNESASLIALALFWLHPIQVESVAYLSGGIETLVTGYLLIALLAGLQGRLWLLLSGFCLFLAVTLKFSALPMLLIVPALIASRRGWIALWLLPALLVGVVLMGVPAILSIQHFSFSWAHVRQLAEAVWRYLAFIVWPFGFSIEHDWTVVAPIWGWLALAATALVGAMTWLFKEDVPLAWIAWVVLVGALLPRVCVAEMPPLTEHHVYGLFIPIWLLCGEVLQCLVFREPVPLNVRIHAAS